MTTEFVYKTLSDCIFELGMASVSDDRDAFITLMYIDGLNTMARAIVEEIEKDSGEVANK